MKKFIAIPLIFCLLILCSCSSLKIKKETAHDSYGIAYDSITIKGPGAFMEEDLVITKDMDGGKVYEVAPYAFFQCKKIESLKATGWFSIHDNAFAECENLKTVTLDGLDEIKNNAFYNCDSLEEVNIIDVFDIGDRAFCDCDNLKKATLSSSSISSIEGEAIFAACPKLETLTIHGFSLGTKSLFSYDLKHLIISSSSLARHALGNCKNLESVTCTNTGVSFDRYTFEFCDKNITITYPGTKAVFKDHAREGLTTLLGGDITVNCTDGTLYYPSF